MKVVREVCVCDYCGEITKEGVWKEYGKDLCGHCHYFSSTRPKKEVLKE